MLRSAYPPNEVAAMTYQQQTSPRHCIVATCVSEESELIKSRSCTTLSRVEYGGNEVDSCALRLQMESTHADTCTCRALGPRWGAEPTKITIMMMRSQHADYYKAVAMSAMKDLR